MGLGQTAISVCNDGNVSQLDVTDTSHGGPYFRIEVYRASQPAGGYGVTASGSRVEYICGKEHLTPRSNKIFRYTFSLGDEKSNRTDLPSVLEGREEFNPPGMPDGSWDVRIRDLDVNSATYGTILRATVKPTAISKQYEIHYELRLAPKSVKRIRIPSPLSAPIAALNTDLIDLGDDLSAFPLPVNLSNNVLSTAPLHAGHRFNIASNSKRTSLDSTYRLVRDTLSHVEFKDFLKNLDAYEGFGDFGAKPTHPGTNLIGPNARLAAESIFVRQYRAALVLLGPLTSPEMVAGAAVPSGLAGTSTNTRPGVYAIFVGAAINHIGIYKLGLDKVHSDYGGVPMKIAPGSRLEDGAKPVADAWRCNQTLGEVADILYLSEPPTSY